jgi:hypothetical protein
MYKMVCQLSELIVLGRSADIALCEPKDIKILGNQNPNPQVELPSVKQHRVFYVLLNDEF